jgi:hypothetical protein
MRKFAAVLLLLSCASAASAQIIDTEVWVGALDLSDGFAVSGLRNISNHPGYDNQPAFLPDGESLLFSSEAESLSETGLGVHAVRYDLRTNRATPLPLARGFSPTPAENGWIMTLREGDVRLHDSSGKPLRTLTKSKGAGYFTRFEDGAWVLFMNDKDRRIVLYDAGTAALETMATGAITAPYRVPGERAVTFVVQEKETLTLHRLDVDAKRVTLLATIPFPTGGHHTWTPDGTLFIASGGTIYEWDPKHPEAWLAVHHFDEPGLQGITRIALSPKADRIAIVSVAPDETVLRDSRLLSNRDMAARLAPYRGTSYVLTTETLQLERDTATEKGTWIRRWRGTDGPVELRGRYTTIWHRQPAGNGTVFWAPQSERTTE